MRFGQRILPALSLALGAFLCVGAAAQQTPPPSALTLESSPFAQPKPGQSPDAAAPATPQGLSLGVLDWAPIASRCTFFADKGAPAELAVAPTDDGNGGTHRPFVFVTMTQAGTTSGPVLERGYVMANGLVRELEKGKTAADKDGRVVTVWRSASEPRINVNLMLQSAQKTRLQAGICRVHDRVLGRQEGRGPGPRLLQVTPPLCAPAPAGAPDRLDLAG